MKMYIGMRFRFYMLVLLIACAGCEDLLEEKSQSEIRPSTVKDMEKLLEGEAYFTETEGPLFNTMTEIFTDNWKSNKLNETSSYTTKYTQKLAQRYRFAWDPLMFEESGGGLDLSPWQTPYMRIKGCNVILDYMDGMEGSEVLRAHVLGEAYALRAFYYFYLVNFFGLPYNYGNPEENPGVPLKLVSGVTDEHLQRNSVAECYNQIVEDLETGSRLMREGKDETPTMKTRMNYLAGYALLSRVFLHMENWDGVIAYADSVLKENSVLYDLKNTDGYGVYGLTDSEELLWGGLCEWFNNADNQKYPFTPSDELVALYHQDVDDDVVDIRSDYMNSKTNRNVYFVYGTERVYDATGNSLLYTDNFVSYTDKCRDFNNEIGGGIRLAEVYLNRAEAYIRRYMQTGDVSDAERALADLNYLRQNRFAEGYVDKDLADFATPQDLLDFCLRERRRELVEEGNHRWFDLRRLGMHEIRHVYVSEEEQETEYILQEADSRFVLPIPEAVKQRNPSLR